MDPLEELREALEKAPVLASGDAHVSEPWRENSNNLRALLLECDPVDFLRWPLVQHLFVTGESPFSGTMLDRLRGEPDWPRWEGALAESDTGSPPRLRCYPRSSANLVDHAFHLLRFEKLAGIRASDASVVLEIGGGYGSMCRLVHRLGFAGAYTIYDLPVLSALQTYYLSSNGLGRVPCVSDLGPAKRLGGRDSVFLALWSLSEIPFPSRAELLDLTESFDFCLLTYQREVWGLDNEQFFSSWFPGSGLEWFTEEIEASGSLRSVGKRCRT